MILFVLILALYVFGYHYERNGNPLNGGELFSRLFWAASFAFGYVALSGPNVSLFIIPIFFVAGYLELMIPHAFAQNIGRWPHPWKYDSDGVALTPVSKYWPGAWLPQYTQAQWDAMPYSRKRNLDLLGMASGAIVRGFILFVPAGIASLWLGGGIYLWGCLLAWAFTALWEPLAYFIGYYIPFKIWDNVAKSVEWGEFLVPVGRAIGMALAVAFAILF